MLIHQIKFAPYARDKQKSRTFLGRAIYTLETSELLYIPF